MAFGNVSLPIAVLCFEVSGEEESMDVCLN